MTAAAGQPAPDFTLPADDGTVALAGYRGRRLVLYFYPKDDTSGCTAEAKAFRDQYEAIAAAGADVLGVSRDSAASHARFRDKHALPFRLASDVEGAVCEAYGVWVEKSMYGRKYMGIERTTILIDEAGTIVRVWRKVKVTGHADAVLTALAQM